jgi:hypothetical protein
MIPILTKVNYAVTVKSFWEINQNCSNKFIVIQSFFSSLLLFLKVETAYRLSELNLFVYIKSCQYSMFKNWHNHQYQIL